MLCAFPSSSFDRSVYVHKQYLISTAQGMATAAQKGCMPSIARLSSHCVIPPRDILCQAGRKDPSKSPQQVQYGADWYRQTREASQTRFRTVREELEYRRRANEIANNGKERKDLYTDNWDGSEYKGSPFNVLTFIGLLFVLVPVLGLAFAYWSYGTLWG